MIHGLCKEGQMEKANDLELEMEDRGQKLYSKFVSPLSTLMRGFFQNNETCTKGSRISSLDESKKPVSRYRQS